MNLRSWKSTWKPGEKNTHRHRRILRTPRWIRSVMESTLFWERFAILVSAAAFIVSALATIATWRQVDLMKSQLTFSDKNRAFQTAIDASLLYCQHLSSPPIKTKTFIFRDQNGKRYRSNLHTITAVRAVSADEEREFFEKAKQLQTKMLLSVTGIVYYIDIKNDNEIEFFKKLNYGIDEFSYSTLPNYDGIDDKVALYRQVRTAANSCIASVEFILEAKFGAPVFIPAFDEFFVYDDLEVPNPKAADDLAFPNLQTDSTVEAEPNWEQAADH